MSTVGCSGFYTGHDLADHFLTQGIPGLFKIVMLFLLTTIDWVPVPFGPLMARLLTLWIGSSRYSRTTKTIQRTFTRLLSDYESCIECHGFSPWFCYVCFSLGRASTLRISEAEMSRHAHHCRIRSSTLRSRCRLATPPKHLTWSLIQAATHALWRIVPVHNVQQSGAAALMAVRNQHHSSCQSSRLPGRELELASVLNSNI